MDCLSLKRKQRRSYNPKGRGGPRPFVSLLLYCSSTAYSSSGCCGGQRSCSQSGDVERWQTTRNGEEPLRLLPFTHRFTGVESRPLRPPGLFSHARPVSPRRLRSQPACRNSFTSVSATIQSCPPSQLASVTPLLWGIPNDTRRDQTTQHANKIRIKWWLKETNKKAQLWQ